MLTATLDTSCFEAGCKNLEHLMKMCEEEEVNLQISEVTMTEITGDHPQKIKQYVEYLNLVEVLKENDVDEPEFNKIANAALKIHVGEIKDTRIPRRKVSNPEEIWKYSNKHRNTYIDVNIFALHVLSKADFFITRDKKGFIKDGRKEKFEKKFNTKVRSLDSDFIDEVKSLNKI